MTVLRTHMKVHTPCGEGHTDLDVQVTAGGVSMSPNRQSMQSNTAFSNAQNSLETADNAVEQAVSHPSEVMLLQAEDSIQKATRAVTEAQRQSVDNPVAADDVAEGLAAIRNRFTRIDSKK